MSQRMRIVLGSLLLALMLANLSISIWASLTPPPGSYDGWSGTWDGRGEPTITSVDAGGPATKLQAGDEMIAINGTKIRQDPSLLAYAQRVPPGTLVVMTVRRAGELRDITIQTAAHPGRRQFSPIFLVKLLFLLTAAAIFALRPRDWQAWLLALMLGTLTGLLAGKAEGLPAVANFIVGLARVAGIFFLPVFVHFFLIFPERSPLLRRWPRLERYLYLPFLLVMLPLMGPPRLSSTVNFWLLRMPGIAWLDLAASALVIAYLAGGLLCLAINYRAADLAARRKLRVMMVGSAAGFLNLLLLVVAQAVGLPPRWKAVGEWIDLALIFTLPLVPLSFAYAIVRHKVIPVSVIIRRGVRYLLVSHGSILLELAAVGGVLFFLMDYYFRYHPATGRTVGAISAAVALGSWALIRRVHATHVAPLIDRRFFRQAYDAQQILSELTQSLRGTTSLEQLAEQVATRIQAALQTANVAVLLCDDATGAYVSEYACAFNAARGQAEADGTHYRLPLDASVVAELASTGQPLELDFTVTDGVLPPVTLVAAGAPASSSAAELQTPRSLQPSLLLPLATQDELLGIIALGPRLGDLPYSRGDKHLLMSVAGPATLAIENARLIEKMIAEAERRREIEAESEQHAKELEEARKLQLSMLPRQVPQPPGLEIAAYMKTATEVGGDYYDFHLAADDTLTIAVGDATGHGLKAGTVVTAMKSLFRTFAHESDLVAVLGRSSRVLKEMNLRALYMGLILVKLKDGHARIAAAGMPPVLIYRAASGQIEEVLIKAMPLGSVANYTYREEETTLTRGDVLVLMSDGFSERFNPEGEMLEDERAQQALLAAVNGSAHAIIEHFVCVGDQWGKGRPQDDDVTFVVVKVG